ncbi:MAG: TIGR00296 family protein [Bacteroidetes bacterium CG02_land_8_20_14_3_00_31_25]|nr:MAG: TIGR00296 family protein [Bacteroidetes bacterium CG02_land_8_20_14_3_00_31_25]PIX35425.1 MAG: TIGR00296 family protein [Bacteroidetes bacterium CG_4_8_14_3_um_filter_31_14]PIY06712.1 MAG: TIGR00296 family protein [Bacteroidetes bacterium CG_4_10_14_3_um_filter_31_20]
MIYKNNLFSLLTLFLMFNCNGQQNKLNMVNRNTYAAGKFYTNNKTELTKELQQLFAKAEPNSSKNLLAIISPHAGYVFSGQVAASAFNQIDTTRKYENIFIIASSHVMLFDGASVYCNGNYETPLGEVKVNTELALKLVNGNKDVFQNYPEPHYKEHSIEVQLPFLQYKLGNNLQIVPIIIGTDSVDVLKEIANILKPYFNSKNLFVISSDFSHYPSYTDAQDADSHTASAIITNNPALLIATLSKNNAKNISKLVTSLCGWTSVLTLMYITEKNQNIEYQKIQYQNSGDSFYGDKEGVVGYTAIAISEKIKTSDSSDFKLSENDKTILLKLARNTIKNYLEKGKTKVDSTKFSNAVKTSCGAFVTLHINDSLRGCVGSFSQNTPLYKVIEEMAIASAIHDTRFNPVTKSEFEKIKIEISVLTPLKKISSIKEIILGKHGIYIKKGYNSGTFLPQVATETGWTVEDFVGRCSQDKAGIGWDGWKNAELYTYEAIVFNEK